MRNKKKMENKSVEGKNMWNVKYSSCKNLKRKVGNKKGCKEKISEMKNIVLGLKGKM